MAETFDRAAVLERLVEHHCNSVNWRDGVAYTYCPSCGEPGCDLAATLAALDTATARVQALEVILLELADLMDAVREGDYTPDTFTTQPARTALALAPPPGEENG